MVSDDIKKQERQKTFDDRVKLIRSQASLKRPISMVSTFIPPMRCVLKKGAGRREERRKEEKKG